jgi:hypothetical protein
MKKSAPSIFPKRKPSKSADASFQCELERIRKLTIEERIIEALSMKERMFGITQIKEEF